jgi:hypothetical protein
MRVRRVFSTRLVRLARCHPTLLALVVATASIGCPRRKDPIGDGGISHMRDASATTIVDANAALPDAARDPGDPPSPRWGTQPPRTAELYVALDGPCRTMDVFVTLDATIVAFEGTTFARATETGFDVDIMRGFHAAFGGTERPGIAEAGGRADDLWVEVDPGGSVFHDTRVVRRREGRWSIVAPLGRDGMHYDPAEAWRGGALMLVTPTANPDVLVPRLVGLDLPKGIATGRLVPPDIRLRSLHALDTGELLVSGARGDGAAMFVLGPEDATAKEITVPKKLGYLTLEGRTRKAFRASTSARRYRLDGQSLVEEELENAPEWRANGAAIQHLVGAGYHDVELPPLPISAATNVRFDSLRIAPDGEAFVVVRWTGKDDIAASVTYYALLRSRRPAETLRCSELSTGADPSGELLPSTETGLEPWPPRATVACAKPFVILFRFTHRERVPKTFPKAEAALAKHADLPHLDLVSVDSGGRRVVGVRAATYEQAKGIAEAMTKELRIEPELVCADPAPL